MIHQTTLRSERCAACSGFVLRSQILISYRDIIDMTTVNKMRRLPFFVWIRPCVFRGKIICFSLFFLVIYYFILTVILHFSGNIENSAFISSINYFNFQGCCALMTSSHYRYNFILRWWRFFTWSGLPITNVTILQFRFVYSPAGGSLNKEILISSIPHRPLIFRLFVPLWFFFLSNAANSEILSGTFMVLLWASFVVQAKYFWCS